MYGVLLGLVASRLGSGKHSLPAPVELDQSMGSGSRIVESLDVDGMLVDSCDAKKLEAKSQ